MGNIATLDPPMSPLLWTSIATGKTADLHGIHGFAEPDPVSGGIRPTTSTSRKVKALWNILSQSGLRSLVVNWFASHPAEPVDGVVVSNAFAVSGPSLPPGAVHPAHMAAEIAELRVEPRDLTGDDLLPFIPKLAQIEQKSDRCRRRHRCMPGWRRRAGRSGSAPIFRRVLRGRQTSFPST